VNQLSTFDRYPTAVPAQEVTVERPGDIPFAGWVGVSVSRPTVRRERPGLLLMIHGLGSDWDEHDRLARRWADRYGLVCLQVRERHAGPRGLEIPADLGKYQTVDCLRAILWALDREDVDPRRVLLWGGSGGGHLALQCALYAPELFAGVVACAPITQMTYPGEISNEWQDGWIRRAIPSGPIPTDEVELRSPVHLIGRLHCDAVVLHGDRDPVVSCEHSRRLVDAAQGRVQTLRYIELPGGDHDFGGAPAGLGTRADATEHYAAHILAEARRCSVGSVRETSSLEGAGILQYTGGRDVTLRITEPA
jgi:acetyl esterase/lipase